MYVCVCVCDVQICTDFSGKVLDNWSWRGQFLW